jgi:uncharacterized protein
MRWLIAQRWEQLLFAHWPVEARDLRPLLPRAVEPDVHGGSAWIAIVAFVMAGTRPHLGPAWRGLAPIPELNVRTYVSVGGVPGVWFLTLDTNSPLFVTMGRVLFGLRYRLARMAAVPDGDSVHYVSAAGEATFASTHAPTGPAAHVQPGSLEDFLFERYRLFAERNGRLITGEVAHAPWRLQPAEAEIRLNRMAPPGIPFHGEPLLHFCPSIDALISTPAPLRARPATIRRPLEEEDKAWPRPRRRSPPEGRLAAATRRR